ncbi:MAG: sulfotransferase [bacterium]|nr:sulfotransferase [bacterium]
MTPKPDPAAAPRSPLPVVLIVGTAFSGSTLLSLLLNTHQNLVSPGEATGPIPGLVGRDYPCSCGARLAECAFWRRAGAAMDRRGSRFGPDEWEMRVQLGRNAPVRFLLERSLRVRALDRLRDALVLRMPGLGRRVREALRRNVALFGALAEVGNASVVVDASKDPRRYAYLRRSPQLELYVLSLVRDAPGFVNSFRRNSGASITAGCRSWARMARHVDRLLAEVPAPRALRMRYEDLCADPARELSRVARWLGVGPFPAELAFRAVEHHVIGNRMRLSGADEIRLDERWRSELSADELRIVVRRTAAVRRRLGYG